MQCATGGGEGEGDRECGEKGGGEGDGKGYGGEAGGREVSSLNCLTIKNTLTDPNRSAVTNKREVTFMVCIVCIFCLFKKKL